MKASAAALGLAALTPLLIAGASSLAAAGGGAASAQVNCSGSTSLDTSTVTKQVRSLLGGHRGKQVRVPGLDLPKEQIPIARTIVATGITLHAPEQGRVVALATAMQESRLRNLNYGDRDSLGVFQQRPSARSWGTVDQIRDPVHASTVFYKRLLAVDGWQQLTVAQAAQKVQRSGVPGAYAKWDPLARALDKAIAPTLPGHGKEAGGKTGKSNADAKLTAVSSGCSPAATGGMSVGPIPPGSVPKGYKAPKAAPPKARKAIRWALGQLGTPYQWGGSCTRSHGKDPMRRCDCSSLMEQAYKAAGVKLSRTTYTQVNEGSAASVDAPEAGDLLFTRGSAARPEHVGMYIGSGLVLNAPKTGSLVRVEPFQSWKSQVLAARRVTN
ncbi:C40 family peptidase [Streptomyces sp. NPDC001633]|uniref:C40 family peptidase n=1 Tax=Streptomyces sp. NPDC001633 TaxID=3364595 RepID=UPI00367499B8